ncbi:hypothetical protein GCM10009862_23510 [Microbacterium binotii]|uniref:Uncharacterized protein n=1 Tax=Microbacterium binotii TaxID=462710 RepID=A0ABP6BRM5_9MICO
MPCSKWDMPCSKWDMPCSKWDMPCGLTSRKTRLAGSAPEDHSHLEVRCSLEMRRRVPEAPRSTTLSV